MCVVWVVLLAGTGMGQVSASKQVVRSTCLVKVSQDSQKEIVSQLAGTADVAGRAARDVLGLDKGVPIGYTVMSSGVVKLTADLPSGVASKASAFWDAVGANLSKAMEQAYKEKVDQIRMQLDEAERQKAEALAKLQGPSTENLRTRATQEQLQKEADLAALNPNMPLADAIERLRNVVNPPLRIVVLWNDLKENRIDQTTPIGMDGINPVRLETALKLLVKAVGSSCNLDYVIDDGAITIATRPTLQSLNRDAPTDPQAGGSSEQLAAKQFELNNKLESSEMELVSLQARRQAIEQQIVVLKKRIDERIAGDSLLGDLKRFVDLQTETEGKVKVMYQPGPAAEKAGEEALDRLIKAKSDLERQREAVAQAAGKELLAKFLSELSELSVRQAELEAQQGVARDQMRKVVTSMTQRIDRDLTMRFLKEAEERIFNLRQGLKNLQPPAITISGAAD
jgi:hypothetical protein